MDAVGSGDLVVLVDGEGHRVLLRALGPAEKVRGLGVVAGERLVGIPWGSTWDHGSRSWWVLRPGITDLAATLPRKAQIVQPKDASRIIHECNLHSGSRVVEAGIGSAFLSSALAWAVAPAGRVTTYEIREDFAQWGRRNLETTGLGEWVDIKVGDVTRQIDEKNVDAVILDIPNPWDAVPTAKSALRGDGYFCAYSPLVSQVEETHRALQRHGFHQIRVLELIERSWHIGERGSRPDHDLLGHTAFLTFARNSLQPPHQSTP